MTLDRRSSRLTIFEGPDGSGKTTAAKDLAEKTGAYYVHLEPFPGVTKGLARLYVEAMMPAILGHSDVVMDRSWLSEEPYGQAFRGGQDRLGIESRRLLERLALRCSTTVVRCRVQWETARMNFLRRKHLEYLDDDTQLYQVWLWYEEKFSTSLPTEDWNYQEIESPEFLDRSDPHRVSAPTAGSLGADVILVGEAASDRGDFDCLYQWPFGSLGGTGCSRWLARQLEAAKISEKNLFWINSDAADDELVKLKLRKSIISLGKISDERLTNLGVPHAASHHPQAWRRFHSNEEYPLMEIIKKVISP